MRGFLLAGAMIVAASAAAHGDLHERIDAATRAIAAAPDDASLVMRRAELRRMHGELDEALADYTRAAELGVAGARLELGRGTVLAELGHLAAAIAALDRALQLEPDSVDALVRRARVRLRTGEAATDDYDRAIERLDRPRPDLYVERARALRSLGRIDAALAGLEEGMRRLGPLASLAGTALELERDARRWDAALARVDTMLVAAERKETLLVERGELLAAAGRDDDARAAFDAAADAIRALPAHLRTAPAVRSLETRVSRGPRTASSSP